MAARLSEVGRAALEKCRGDVMDENSEMQMFEAVAAAFDAE